jgi:hypothetical protein
MSFNVGSYAEWNAQLKRFRSVGFKKENDGGVLFLFIFVFPLSIHKNKRNLQGGYMRKQLLVGY